MNSNYLAILASSNRVRKKSFETADLIIDAIAVSESTAEGVESEREREKVRESISCAIK